MKYLSKAACCLIALVSVDLYATPRFYHPIQHHPVEAADGRLEGVALNEHDGQLAISDCEEAR